MEKSFKWFVFACVTLLLSVYTAFYVNIELKAIGAIFAVLGLFSLFMAYLTGKKSLSKVLIASRLVTSGIFVVLSAPLFADPIVGFFFWVFEKLMGNDIAAYSFENSLSLVDVFVVLLGLIIIAMGAMVLVVDVKVHIHIERKEDIIDRVKIYRSESINEE